MKFPGIQLFHSGATSVRVFRSTLASRCVCVVCMCVYERLFFFCVGDLTWLTATELCHLSFSSASPPINLPALTSLCSHSFVFLSNSSFLLTHSFNLAYKQIKTFIIYSCFNFTTMTNRFGFKSYIHVSFQLHAVFFQAQRENHELDP